jgi:hypothetical protein
LSSGLASVEPTPRGSANEPSSEGCQNQVHRILHSNTFRSAATLQALLQFITSKTISGEGDSLKEYTIGVEALGRRSDFDPKVDPIVRVQSHRLRIKLREYYDTEGSNDPILIQFPKGHYVPTFETVVPESVKLPDAKPDSETEPPAEPISTVEEPDKSNRRGPAWWRIPAVGLLSCFMLGFGCVVGGWRAQKQSGSQQSVGSYDPEVVAFWARLLGNDTTPVIAYPDAVFLLDDSNDLFRFRHGAIDSRGALVDPHVAREFAANPELVAQAGQLYYENGYTGTGELESVAMLAGLLGKMGVRPIIKSSRDVLPEDLAHHSVILLGSPFQNPAVAQLMTAGDFRFNNPDQHHEQWRAQIVNAHPEQGEAAIYGTERDATSKTLTADFGVITLTRSAGSGRWVAILGGLDTKGTEGAAMFVTSRAGVEHLNEILGERSGGSKDLFPFQALVHVDLAKGYLVMGADLVALHPIQAHSPAAAK